MSETSWKTKSSWKKGNTHFEFFGDLDVRWDVFEAVADQVDHGVCAIWLKWILERKQFVPHGPIKLQIEINRNYSLRMLILCQMKWYPIKYTVPAKQPVLRKNYLILTNFT